MLTGTAGPTEPEGGDVNRGPHLSVLVLVQCSVAVVILCLRIYSRFMIRGLGWDDWLMLLTLILFIITAGFLVHLAAIGGCRHLYYLSDSEMFNALKLNWIVQPFAIMSFATSKASVGLVLIRIIGTGGRDKRVWFLWALIVLSVIINTVGAIMVFAQCDPPEALWTPDIPSNCWDPSVQMNYELFAGSWNAFCDFCLAVLPITIVYPLQMSIKKRVGCCVLLGLGILACASACVKTSTLSSLTARADLTWETFELWSWTVSETFLLILCGSIPPIRPLYDRIVGRDKDEYGNPKREYRDAKSPKHSSNGNTSSRRKQSCTESTSGFASKAEQQARQDIELEEGWCHKMTFEDGISIQDKELEIGSNRTTHYTADSWDGTAHDARSVGTAL